MSSTSCCVVGVRDPFKDKVFSRIKFFEKKLYPRIQKTLSSKPVSFFKQITEKQLDRAQHAIREKSTIRCKACQHPITCSENKIEINGHHRHIFSNPVGIFYEIGCFSLANGCVNKGAASLEYTWFPGFFWRFALCSKCYSHLGWVYHSDNERFYGLILETLEER